ncbi:hypothetical protein CY34DRAFT_78256 [Suillus luteus UH-Slu-Lm8-n1]|uniref:Uncharacterized protein n=1 Tax=Suillus luteus UH-Slu-Lm8-n1 TaxID=930992 RepID=A0A0D0B5W4_9AGAM|nr:hypothetical protein CY34DRAFT_78256 [Suillus luteus UH-Slu-Lm8-n1]
MEKPGGALEWSRNHNAEFELDKTALICVSRRCSPDPSNRTKTIPIARPAITIRQHTIQPSKSHKFLGVIVDEELRFKEHASYALAKGTKYMMACSRMTRPTKGIHGRLLKKLYEGVVVPKMLYAADVWCAGLLEKGRGKKNGGRGARGFAAKMTRVQRMASSMITGGMRSTATDVMDAHANILPFQQLLRKICYRAILRMATLPPNHPLFKGIKSAYENCAIHNFDATRKSPSPIHSLLKAFRTNPNRMEKILPVRHYTKWHPDVTTEIAEDSESALKADKDAQEDI